MISKKNSALIFDPKFTLPFKKHEIFGGVVHVPHMTTNIHKILLDLLRK